MRCKYASMQRLKNSNFMYSCVLVWLPNLFSFFITVAYKGGEVSISIGLKVLQIGM